MGGERTCVGAAVDPSAASASRPRGTAVALRNSRTPRTAVATDVHHLLHGRVDDQVDVAQPDPGLRVGEPLVLVRQRAQALRRRSPTRSRRTDSSPRRLVMTSPRRRRGRRGRCRAASATSDVRRRPGRGSSITWIAGAVSEGREAQLAAVRLSTTRPAIADLIAGGGVRRQIRVCGPDLAAVVVRGKPTGYGSTPSARSRSSFSRRTRICSGRSSLMAAQATGEPGTAQSRVLRSNTRRRPIRVRSGS